MAAPIPLAAPVTERCVRPIAWVGLYDVPVPLDPVTVIGGTGALGFGLAARLAQQGTPVVIGSRDAGRAGEAAARGAP